MRSTGKLVLLVSVFTLMLSAKAFALPVANDVVTMTQGPSSGVPYTMTDTAGAYIYETFCLEKYDFFNYNTSYTVQSVGEYAVGGGNNLAPDGNVGDLVEADTKWLYAAYFGDQLGVIAAQTVQEIIWLLEGELEGAGDSGTKNTAQSAWDEFTDPNGSFYGIYTGFDASGWNVIAVNLTNAAGDDIQSQLVGEAVPEPTTMLLFGTGLIGLAGIARRKKK